MKQPYGHDHFVQPDFKRQHWLAELERKGCVPVADSAELQVGWARKQEERNVRLNTECKALLPSFMAETSTTLKN